MPYPIRRRFAWATAKRVGVGVANGGSVSTTCSWVSRLVNSPPLLSGELSQRMNSSGRTDFPRWPQSKLIRALFGALSVFALMAVFRSIEALDRRASDAQRDRRTALATLVVVASPLFWFTALRPLSDGALPCGFVCGNDRTAGELMRALLAMGCRIPEEFRIVGIDDVEYASLLPVPLTTVRQPCREIGEAAMAAMLERVARPGLYVRDILIECRLVVRESCGALLLSRPGA